MRVERFSLFFGPMLLKFRRGETEYGIGPIPLGGYVKITGMNPREELAPEVVPRAYYNQPVWKRIVVIMAGPVVNIVIAFVIVWLLFLANGQAGASKRVAVIEKGTPAAKVSSPATSWSRSTASPAAPPSARPARHTRLRGRLDRQQLRGRHPPRSWSSAAAT